MILLNHNARQKKHTFASLTDLVVHCAGLVVSGTHGWFYCDPFEMGQVSSCHHCVGMLLLVGHYRLE